METVILCADPYRAAEVSCHTQGVSSGPAAAAGDGPPARTRAAREQTVLRNDPKRAGRVFAYRPHRLEGQPRFGPQQLERTWSQTIQSAAAGAGPNIALAVLCQTPDLRVGRVHQFNIGSVESEQTTGGGADPHGPVRSSRRIFGAMPSRLAGRCPRSAGAPRSL